MSVRQTDQDDTGPKKMSPILDSIDNTSGTRSHQIGLHTIGRSTITMSALPRNLDFPATEDEICVKWAEEQTFRIQDKLSLERNDKVRTNEKFNESPVENSTRGFPFSSRPLSLNF